MAFGINTLNKSRIIALLSACPDGSTAPATECSTRWHAWCSADYAARDFTIHPRLISGSAANLGKGELLTDSIVVTKLIERYTGARQHHDAGFVGHAGATGDARITLAGNTMKKKCDILTLIADL